MAPRRTPIDGRRSGGAKLALLVAAAAGLLVLVAALTLRDQVDDASGGTVTRVDVPRPRAATPSDDPVARLNTSAAQPARADGTSPSAQDTEAGPREVRAIDAFDGSPILRFWTEVDRVGDMTLGPERTASDPETGVASVPRTAAFLVVHAPGYLPTNGAHGGAERFVVELERATGILGTVVDGLSAPVPSANVTLEYLGELGATVAMDAEPKGAPEGYAGPTLRRTDGAGAFRFDRLPEGTYRTTVTVDGARQTSAPLRVVRGRWKESNHWLDERHRIVVTVLTPDGLPAAKARVTLERAAPSGGGDTGLHRYTDAYGEATLGPMAPGEYAVMIRADQGTYPGTSVKLEESSPTILPMTCSLERNDTGGAAGAPTDR